MGFQLAQYGTPHTCARTIASAAGVRDNLEDVEEQAQVGPRGFTVVVIGGVPGCVGHHVHVPSVVAPFAARTAFRAFGR
jgi:hypothetical protein